MTDEKLEKTKTRRYPPEVDDADIELIIKEWRLTGYEVLSEGDIVVVVDPQQRRDENCVGYQRRGSTWHWINLSLLHRLLDRHRAKEDAARMNKAYDHQISKAQAQKAQATSIDDLIKAGAKAVKNGG